MDVSEDSIYEIVVLVEPFLWTRLSKYPCRRTIKISVFQNMKPMTLMTRETRGGRREVPSRKYSLIHSAATDIGPGWLSGINISIELQVHKNIPAISNEIIPSMLSQTLIRSQSP
jgi:hypothetical protein